MHLLQGGVTPEIIVLWLGPKSPHTTHLYIEADLETKRRALEVLVPPRSKRGANPDEDPLIRILEQL
jgi:integrase/recombinase XerD